MEWRNGRVMEGHGKSSTSLFQSGAIKKVLSRAMSIGIKQAVLLCARVHDCVLYIKSTKRQNPEPKERTF